MKPQLRRCGRVFDQHRRTADAADDVFSRRWPQYLLRSSPTQPDVVGELGTQVAVEILADGVPPTQRARRDRPRAGLVVEILADALILRIFERTYEHVKDHRRPDKQPIGVGWA